ncbi:MAG: hypothetical protein COA78_35900 [Blastopirellula sp.]|nr:MAG: hypothetical protein COA78_35900 [Blastopirellula sp.]
MLRSGAIFLVVALVLSGCGGGDDRPDRPQRPVTDDSPAVESSTPEEPTKSEEVTEPESSTPDPAPTEKTETPETVAPKPEEKTTEAPAATGDWGTLKGKFVVKGKLPALKPLDVTKDKGFCGLILPDKTIVVGKNNELANVCLWLSLGRTDKAPTPHSSYADSAEETLFIDNVGCLYAPRIYMAQPGQKIMLRNKDQVAHNFKIDGFSNNSINLLVPVGAEVQVVPRFNKEESYPMNAGCAIHPWMSGKLLIKSSPYMAVSLADGTFEIKNLPIGTHKFKLWHEKPGNLKNLKGNSLVESDRKGIVEIEIKPGDNDLGVIEIDASMLE